MWNLFYLNAIDHGSSLLRGLCRKRIKFATCSNISKSLVTRTRCSSKPPWRVLFFGSDDFAVESLKQLYASREDRGDAVVDSLEVVTLSSNVPVRKFADRHKLRAHDWPNVDFSGCFDVGVVVSFGCLLQESIINKFPYGILNVHPSLLPRWRGPAPVFHTVLHGDKITGVTIMQIRPTRFDVGPILSRELYQVPEKCTADQLGAYLAVLGAELLIDTLRNLPERIANRKEQAKEGATFAPKISTSMSWLVWEEQTCDQISQLFRAIGFRIPLRTIWMDRTVKLQDFVGKCKMPFTENSYAVVPGSIHYDKESNTILVCCKDGWVGFKTITLKKRLSAADFFNGYLHQDRQKNSTQNNYRFQSYRPHFAKGQNAKLLSLNSCD
ncbi:methionyl-tRNA formyltransferase, mitochondrial [Electrophorus electricus]|uniref:Methionyl-tRNA formyltransferase, mitochondrial n=1 Tax=Electrophorus electricus TaxID=8005 RepID=A0A4W4GH91_ELEEL|nr:methionyl-tRNA formyltransferase, mitochondrial [Electrophorus electricus]